jgi:putative transposase
VAKYLGSIFHELAMEGYLCPDHIHMLIEIPPKYAVAQVIGYIKGKSAIAIARRFVGKQKNFSGQNFWARGYYVSTVGRDEATIRKYIREQEAEDHRLAQLEMFRDK